jgi:hypothetical protein
MPGRVAWSRDARPTPNTETAQFTGGLKSSVSGFVSDQFDESD